MPLSVVPAMISAAISSATSALESILPADTPPTTVSSGVTWVTQGETKKGTLQAVDNNVLLLNGDNCLLAPGGQIRDSNNLIVLPFTLQSPVNVRYQLNESGQIYRAWIISSQ